MRQNQTLIFNTHSCGSIITVGSVIFAHHIIMSRSYSSSYWVQHFTHFKEHWKLFIVKASWYWVKLVHSCFEAQHFYGRLHTQNSLWLIAVKVANAVKWVLYFQGGLDVTGNILNKIITLWFILDTFLINCLVQNYLLSAHMATSTTLHRK